ncbi:MAG: leucyl aminopeptidase family protein [Steroidobacteraceae bacterium]
MTLSLSVAPADSPTIRRLPRLPGARALAGLDVLLLVAPKAGSALFERLPEAARWRSLHQRAPARAGQARSTTLANARSTFAVLGHAADASSAFQRLELAGRMLHELGELRPARIAVLVAPELAERAGWYEALVAAVLAWNHVPPDYRSKPSPRRRLRSLELHAAPPLDLARIGAAARGTNLVRQLTALPPNVLDARGYRRLLARLARRHGLALRWYPERALRRLGCGAFLAVARGNAARDAGIAHLRWRGHGRRRGAPVALVGKGILFDTGGTNLKPHRHMLDMHTDMAGSAVALATLVALAELDTPYPVDAWLAITENNIGPSAYRPQEVVRAANGTTIQVIHTDAEGRMALADTLVLAARRRPRLLVDFATLTGSCIQALTERYSGVFARDAALAERARQAGAASGERVWPFPLDADFDADLDSRVADVKQCTIDSKGDHILAARFLARFVPDALPWLHVDLASAVRTGGLAHVGDDITGFGVRFALALLAAEPA